VGPPGFAVGQRGRPSAPIHLDAKARLVGVVVRGAARAWQYRALAVHRVHNDTVAGLPVLLVYRPDVTGIGDSSDLRHAPRVGIAAVYAVCVAGRTLHFRPPARRRCATRRPAGRGIFPVTPSRVR
jgi:hypothetical protein